MLYYWNSTIIAIQANACVFAACLILKIFYMTNKNLFHSWRAFLLLSVNITIMITMQDIYRAVRKGGADDKRQIMQNKLIVCQIIVFVTLKLLLSAKKTVVFVCTNKSCI